MKQKHLELMNEILELIRDDHATEEYIMSRLASPNRTYPEKDFNHLQEAVTDRLVAGE